MKYLEVEGARRPEAEGQRRRAGQHVEVRKTDPIFDLLLRSSDLLLRSDDLLVLAFYHSRAQYIGFMG